MRGRRMTLTLMKVTLTLGPEKVPFAEGVVSVTRVHSLESLRRNPELPSKLTLSSLWSP